MFVEQSPFRGTVRVRIVDKVLVQGKWAKKVVRHVGTGHSDAETAALVEAARHEIANRVAGGQMLLSLSPPQVDPVGALRMDGVYWEGAEVLLGSLFDRLGLETTLPSSSVLRHLVMARILDPCSKRRTARLLNERFGTTYEGMQLYRYMDTLAAHQDAVLNATRRYVTTSYPTTISYVLYDVTTLYFETDFEDDQDGSPKKARRAFGYSKDHRHDLPQLVLGLTVNTLGMPLAYDIYSGNTPETKTFISSITKMSTALTLPNVTIVADAGMLSDTNLISLEKENLSFIVGARIKSLPAAIKEEILSHDFSSEPLYEFTYNSRRLIVAYSQTRATRDRQIRTRAVARLTKRLASGQAIRRTPYLHVPLEGTPSLDHDAIAQAERWDGIKGYITNNPRITADDAISHYHQLYQVENSFRISKSDLRMRPTFHFKPERLESHIVLCMLSLLVLRILEQALKPLHISPQEAVHTLSLAQAGRVTLASQPLTIPPRYTHDQILILDQLGLGHLVT